MFDYPQDKFVAMPMFSLSNQNCCRVFYFKENVDFYTAGGSEFQARGPATCTICQFCFSLNGRYCKFARFRNLHKKPIKPI